jgi:hypothetical protein
MPFGYLDTRYIDFPAGVDVAYLQGLRTRAGVDFPRVLREIDSRLGTLNTTLDPLVASLITPTTEQFADTSGPTAFEVSRRGEYTTARPQLAEGGAHMLPLYGWDVSLGFTEDGLEAMSLSRILTNIDSMLLGFRRLYRREALRRLTSDAEVRVADRTAVTSPGMAGSGTGDNVFARSSYPDGTTLPGGYTHYYAVGAGTLAATLKSARDRLKRWHQGPFDLVAPAAQLDLITAISPGDPQNGFVSAGSALVRAGNGTAEAQVDAAVYLGVLFGDVRVHMAIEDYSDPVIAMYKSYGALDPRNPLAWRYDELKGRSAVVRYRSLYPLDQATLKQDFGIGTNDRTAAVLIENGTAPYSAPAIS